MSNLMKLILMADSKKFELPTAEIKIKRLSDMLGEDAVLKIRALSFDRLEEIRESSQSNSNTRIQIVLASVVDFDFGDPALKEKFGLSAKTPKSEILKKILTAGEIEEIYFKVSQISGYNRDTIEEIKKK